MLSCISFLGSFWVGFHFLTKVFGRKKSFEDSLHLGDDDRHGSCFLSESFLFQIGKLCPMGHCKHFQWLIKFSMVYHVRRVCNVC